jgi:hypothetical protein
MIEGLLLTISQRLFFLKACFKSDKLKTVFFVLFLFLFSSKTLFSQSLPYLNKENNRVQLIVDDKPFLMLGGELGNSTTGSIEYLKPIWQQMVDMNVNTVLPAVSWEMIEPEEGKYDFSIVDAMILGAREKGIRIIPLWFGTWKNGMSSYVPLWVKKDYKRFPRIKTQDNGSVEIISTFSEEALEADKKAFAALLRHIKKVDSKHHTVIMVQVENEVGVLGDSRDRSLIAEKAFNSLVPNELMIYIIKNKNNLIPQLYNLWSSNGFKESGTWAEVFGSGIWTDTVFMAWNYAKYVNEVAKAGKAEYNLPMFVNAWLELPPLRLTPGTFPSGGPLPRVMDIWKAGAPAIDFMAPDIYAENFVDWCDWYTQQGDPLFIPETWWTKPEYVRYLFYAFGNYVTMGVAPFGIDRLNPAENPPIKHMYKVMNYLSPYVLEHQGNKDRIASFLLDKQKPYIEFDLGEFRVRAELYSKRGEVNVYGVDDAYGMIIRTGNDEFIISGERAMVTFKSKNDETVKVGIGQVDEVIYKDDKWKMGRRLGGDETYRGRAVQLLEHELGIQKVKVYKFK